MIWRCKAALAIQHSLFLYFLTIQLISARPFARWRLLFGRNDTCNVRWVMNRFTFYPLNKTLHLLQTLFKWGLCFIIFPTFPLAYGVYLVIFFIFPLTYRVRFLTIFIRYVFSYPTILVVCFLATAAVGFCSFGVYVGFTGRGRALRGGSFWGFIRSSPGGCLRLSYNPPFMLSQANSLTVFCLVRWILLQSIPRRSPSWGLGPTLRSPAPARRTTLLLRR
jgi:hypothetical protein